MHLADAFIQSDLQCIQAIHFFISVCSLGIEPTTFYAANAMLYHWATGTKLSFTFISVNFLTENPVLQCFIKIWKAIFVVFKAALIERQSKLSICVLSSKYLSNLKVMHVFDCTFSFSFLLYFPGFIMSVVLFSSDACAKFHEFWSMFRPSKCDSLEEEEEETEP